MEALKRTGRAVKDGSKLRWKYYIGDYPLKVLAEVWTDTAGFNPDQRYVVETRTKVVERCLLMTTDPGDLVFDPTCGSGTTAYVAEQWGRRWITCDTSRVALAIARQRLTTAVFDYYELAYPHPAPLALGEGPGEGEQGVWNGFKYKTVPHVTLKSIANNPEIDGIYTRMHPAIERALAELNSGLKSLSPGRSPKGGGEKNPPPVGEGGRTPGEGYPRYRVTTGGREGQFVDFAAPDSATFTMPSGQVVKVSELAEWEVPVEFPADWPDAVRKPFDAFHAARRAMQQKMDEAIARHADQETLYDQPLVDNKKTRVSGPFTVEAVPAPAVKSVDELLEGAPQIADASIARSGETLRQSEWRDELMKTGIRGKAGQRIRFSRLEPLPGCRWLHAEGETQPSNEGADSVREEAPAYNPMRVVVSFGPEHAPLEQRQVAQAIEEAQTLVPKPRLIVFAAFQFDPEAARDIDETNWPGVALLKAQMNADLLTEDLKKKRASNESFWLIGQPDVEVERIAPSPRPSPIGRGGEGEGALYRVSVHGFDYYNTKTGAIESGGEDKIAVWLLDTDYDGRSLYPRQVFFPMAGARDGWARLAKNLRAEIDEERIEAYRGTVSLPFELGTHKRIAVKIVDDRGIESLRVIEIAS
jgi:adenine-specific DNA-methyltransferase